MGGTQAAAAHAAVRVIQEPSQTRIGLCQNVRMSANEHQHVDYELIVAADGSIPADQLAHLGVAPGAHLRVVKATPASSVSGFAGSLHDFPDLSWEDFERGSELARSDLSHT